MIPRRGQPYQQRWQRNPPMRPLRPLLKQGEELRSSSRYSPQSDSVGGRFVRTNRVPTVRPFLRSLLLVHTAANHAPSLFLEARRTCHRATVVAVVIVVFCSLFLSFSSFSLADCRSHFSVHHVASRPAVSFALVVLLLREDRYPHRVGQAG